MLALQTADETSRQHPDADRLKSVQTVKIRSPEIRTRTTRIFMFGPFGFHLSEAAGFSSSRVGVFCPAARSGFIAPGWRAKSRRSCPVGRIPVPAVIPHHNAGSRTGLPAGIPTAGPVPACFQLLETIHIRNNTVLVYYIIKNVSKQNVAVNQLFTLLGTPDDEAANQMAAAPGLRT